MNNQVTVADSKDAIQIYIHQLEIITLNRK